jgi:hypothetical protein
MNLKAMLGLLAVVAGAKDGWAWGATGHEWISGIAIEKLPDMIATPVILAILDRVRKEPDGYYTVTIGFSDGSVSTLRFSEAAARMLMTELGRVLPTRG